MSEIQDLLDQVEELSLEKLRQVRREVKDIVSRIEELPTEIVGYTPLDRARDLLSVLDNAIEELEEK